MELEDYTHYAPAHSDYLIHWTGIHIDNDHDPDWQTKHSSTTDSDVTTLYLDRLKSILKYGLWMTDDDESVNIKGKEYRRPSHCRTCFTELKLSIIRGHAKRYGRLGIGFKRPFLLNRFGRPMVYYHHKYYDWFEPRMMEPPNEAFSEYFSCFLKPMSHKTNDTTMRYTYYDESEWRIIYSEDIASRLKKRGHQKIESLFVPEDKFSSDFQEAISSAQKKPSALIPVNDAWFTVIIYPSLAVKVASQSDSELRELIETIKPNRSMQNLYDKKNPAWLEPHSKPVEIELDACRNF